MACSATTMFCTQQDGQIFIGKIIILFSLTVYLFKQKSPETISTLILILHLLSNLLLFVSFWSPLKTMCSPQFPTFSKKDILSFFLWSDNLSNTDQYVANPSKSVFLQLFLNVFIWQNYTNKSLPATVNSVS